MDSPARQARLLASIVPARLPLFQRRTSNGGLGVCLAAVISETVMIARGQVQSHF
jgi:hypothetical protein